MAIDEKVLGPERTSLATDLLVLAMLYQGAGRYAEAEPLSPCHPSVQPRGPQRRWGDEPLQARLEAADAAPEEGGQAAAGVAGVSVRGFFSSGVGPGAPAPTPVGTAQNRARAQARVRRARRSGAG